MDSYLSRCLLRCGPQPRARVAVDTWRTPGCGAYFCTHAHADHTAGLSDAWSDGQLFCSEPTATLLLLKWPALRNRITALRWDDTVVIDVGGVLTSVTPFFSGHCPGSAAFLFHNDEMGRVLHTGDWRLEDLETLPAAVRATPVDVLYMDNTFCHPCYDHPPRAVALMHLRAAVATHTRTGDERMLLGIDTLGKEELLQEVAAALDCKVAVTEARLQCARALGLQTSHLTTCWHEARIVTVPRWRVTPKGVATLQVRQIQDGGVPFTAALVPTGWARHVESNGQVSISRDGATMPAVTIVSVPYSLHASFTELRRLVEAVRPRVLIGVVASARFADAPIDPVLHFGHLLRHDSPRRALQPLVEESARGVTNPEAPPRASTPHMPAGNARAQDAVQYPGTRSLLTLSPAAMLACMQRAAGKAAQAVLSTARKRAACMLVMTPSAAAPPNVGDAPDGKVKLDGGLENKPGETNEEHAVKRTRTE